MEQLFAALLQLRTRVDELCAERQQYLALFEQAADAHLITDRIGVIREANRAAAELLQRRHSALLGKPLAALVPLAHRAAFRIRLAMPPQAGSPWRTVLGTAESLVEVDLAVRRAASGALCWRLRPAH